jgi:DNA-binding Lrp family transcriptional regulator
MALDRILFELLSRLTKNARLSNKELAAAAGLAPSTCHERLKQLREMGIWRGAHADVDLRQLGLSVEALVQVELRKHRQDAVDAFVKRLSEAIEVRQVFLVAGRFDLMAHVTVRDMEHLRDLAYAHFTSHEDVIRIETAVVFQSWSFLDRLPVEAPSPDRFGDR